VNITPIIAMSCAPKPIYFNFEVNGVINVHPAVVDPESLD